MKLDTTPEYCWKCHEVCPVFTEGSPEGIAFRCEVCGAGLDFVYREDVEVPERD